LVKSTSLGNNDSISASNLEKRAPSPSIDRIREGSETQVGIEGIASSVPEVVMSSISDQPKKVIIQSEPAQLVIPEQGEATLVKSDFKELAEPSEKRLKDFTVDLEVSSSSEEDLGQATAAKSWATSSKLSSVTSIAAEETLSALSSVASVFAECWTGDTSVFLAHTSSDRPIGRDKVRLKSRSLSYNIFPDFKESSAASTKRKAEDFASKQTAIFPNLVTLKKEVKSSSGGTKKHRTKTKSLEDH
jgi:hypothetical protein